MCGFPDSYDVFIQGFNTDEFVKYYNKIVLSYRMIPSTEIWMSNTIDSFLKLLNYHREMNHFEDDTVPTILCEQLLNMLDDLQNLTEKGVKNSTDIPYNFYISEIDIGNTFILFKTQEITSCLVRLFTINGINISDEIFCRETENWLNILRQHATLISKASAKVRNIFFTDQKQKIKQLMNSFIFKSVNGKSLFL